MAVVEQLRHCFNDHSSRAFLPVVKADLFVQDLFGILHVRREEVFGLASQG